MWVIVLCVLFRVVTCKNENSSAYGANSTQTNPSLEIKHCYRSTCPLTGEDKSFDYTFEEGSDVTVTCKSMNSPLQWIVPTYQVISDEMYATKVSFNIEKLDRNDDHLKIKCKNYNGETEITFLWNNIPKKKETYTLSRDYSNSGFPEFGQPHDKEHNFSKYESLQFIEGETLATNFLENCIIKKQNSTVTDHGNDELGSITVEHNQSTLLCAKFQKNLNSKFDDTRNILKLDKYFVTVITKPTDTKKYESANKNRDNDALQTNQISPNKMYTDEPSTDKDRSDTENQLPILQIVGGSIALFLLLVSFFLVYRFHEKRRQRLNEDIYSEPQQVAYAEIICNGPGVFFASKNEPYAQIIGVMKKNKPPLPPLPPPRNKRSLNTDEEDTINERDMDNNQRDTNKCNGENNYSEIQHQND